MWFTIGMVFGALILGAVWLLKRNNLSLTWYEWLMGIVGLALLLFTIQNFFASFAELEPTAAYLFLLATGLPAVILLAVTWQLAVRRNKSS